LKWGDDADAWRQALFLAFFLANRHEETKKGCDSAMLKPKPAPVAKPAMFN
jgi:hypothetical protein